MHTRNFYYPPLEIKKNRKLGYHVVAIEDIKKHTLICEYSGVICLFDENDVENDRQMTLFKIEEKTYVINPLIKGNIA